MLRFKCYPIDDPNSIWNYCPSFPAAVLFCDLFGIVTIVHIIQASIYMKPFTLVLCIGAAWECAGYAFRILSVMYELNSTYATVQQLLILLAPLWVNAFIYMVIGRAIHFFLDDDRVFGIRARRVTFMFVLFDIGSPEAGVDEAMYKSPERAVRLLYIVYTILVLIIFRNIYRLSEFSEGVLSSITTHEWYGYVFDALPMLFAFVVLSFFYPGKVLRGPRCEFSEENREIKAAKKAKQTAKRQQRDEKAGDKLRAKALKNREQRLLEESQE